MKKDELLWHAARKKFRNDFEALVEYVLWPFEFGNVKLCDWHRARVREIGDSIAQDAPKTLDLWFRGGFKTTFISRYGIIFRLLRNPDVTILIRHGDASKAIGVVKGIKNQFMHNNDLRDLFPEFCPERGAQWGTQDSLDLPNSKNTSPEHSVTGVGIEANLTGGHWMHIHDDDIENSINVNTPDTRIKLIRTWEDTPSLLCKPPVYRGTHSMVGTPWHASGLWHHVITKFGPSSDAPPKKKVVLRFWPACESDLEPLAPDVLDRAALEELLYDEGPYKFSCTPAESPILMADWTFRPVSKVNVGDEVIGFVFGDGKKRRLVKTRVTAKGNRVAPVQRVEMESGRVIRCTPDHKWFTGRLGKSESDWNGKSYKRKAYHPASVGRGLLRVTDAFYSPTEKQRLEWRYMAGMVDGEGCCKFSNMIVSQSIEKNPEVYARILKSCGILGIGYTCYDQAITLKGARELKARMIRHGEPGKKYQLIRSVMERHTRMVVEKDRVREITPQGDETVYSIQTETGNYVVWGYASKNCNYRLRPVDEENAVFRQEWIKRLPYPKEWDKTDKGWLGTCMAHRCLTIDLAESQKRDADLIGYLVVDIDSDGRWYIHEVFERRMDTLKFIKRVQELHEEWNFDKVYIDAVASQNYFSKWLKRENELVGVKMPIVPVRKSEGQKSKYQRILSCQARWARGDCNLMDGAKNANVLIHDMTNYPAVGHDDLLDAMAQLEMMEAKGKRRSSSKSFPEGSLGYFQEKMMERDRREMRVGDWRRSPKNRVSIPIVRKKYG